MQEKALTKIALITTLLGLVGLFVLSTSTEVPVSTADSLAEEADGKTVKIRGVIIESRDLEKVAFLTVAEEKMETTTVVLFKDHPLDLSEGAYVEIEGTLETYKGEKEIIANKIEIR